MYKSILFIMILLFVLTLFNYWKPKNVISHLYPTYTPFPIDIVYTWAGDRKEENIRIRNNNELILLFHILLIVIY